jgi:hypothetical protein
MLTIFLCLVGLLVVWLVVFNGIFFPILEALNARNMRIDSERWFADRRWQQLVDIYKERGLPVPPRPGQRPYSRAVGWTILAVFCGAPILFIACLKLAGY